MSTTDIKKTSTLVISHISSLAPAKLLDDDGVAAKFIDLYNRCNNSKNGEMILHQQTFHFKKLVSETPKIRESSPLSLYGVILDVAVNNLSLEPGAKPDCYITTRNFHVGNDSEGKKIWETRAQLAISPYGELKIRMRAGQIKYADNPVIVYEEDYFRVKLVNGVKVIDYEAKIPRTSKRIIASFIRLVRMDGSVDFSVLTEENIEVFKEASNKNNKGTEETSKANALYTSVNGGIHPGFLAAKTIKHAFSTYPKVKIGKYSALETEENPEEEIDYGLETETVDITHKEVDELEEELKITPTEEESYTPVLSSDDDLFN